MKNANFTNLRTLLVAVIALFATAANAQLACNDNVQVSVDPTADFSCTVDLSADAILEGTNNGTYTLTIMDGLNPIASGVNVVSFDANPYLGETLDVKVEEGVNSCWGSIVVEDKVAPVCASVSDYTIDCTEEIPAADDTTHPYYPTFADNCSVASITLGDHYVADDNICTNGGVQIYRVWFATDASGNTTPGSGYPATGNGCVQLITIERAPVAVPVSADYSCADYAIGDLTPDVTGWPTNTDAACMYLVTYSDVILPSCGGLEKIVRTWTIMDMCNNNAVTTSVQVISLVDYEGPSITGNNYVVNANVAANHPQPCSSTEFVALPTITDNCTDIVEINMFAFGFGELEYVYGANGEILGGYIPSPGLELGSHQILVNAIDACGNYSENFFNIDVVDAITPTTICKEITTVTLTTNGTATVPAASFDNGSYDNCCLDYLEVRRMDDAVFGPTATFDCEDETVMVVLRAVDCFENYSDCMVEIIVEDKMNPVVLCPSDSEIACDVYYNDYAPALDNGDWSVLEVFGTATIFDNCSYTSSYNVTYSVNQCGEGTIDRKWENIVDASGNGPVSCTQTIEIYHVSDWNVSFPADFDQPVDADCNYEDLDFGNPSISNDECEMIAVSYTDQVFAAPGTDACFKVIREWEVINWCTYHPTTSQGSLATVPNFDYNVTGSDYITFIQTIHVKDNVAPTVSAEDFTVQVDADACYASTVSLDDITVEGGCTNDNYNISLNDGDLAGYGANGTYFNVPAGEYNVTYTVIDPCGNAATIVRLVVVEEKAPTAYCTDELVIDLMLINGDGMATVNAADFNFASSDNCTLEDELTFAFDAANTIVELTFDCSQLGSNGLEMYVFDAAGLYDFCVVTLNVQDNLNACGTGSLTVAGAINTESVDAVNGVTVEINGGLFTATTTTDGTYEITGVAAGSDISIAPSLEDNITNGVTTFDIVKITQHILGIQELDSAYKLIAADANNSASITTLDIVSIRKAILQIETEFPNNTSWRFVDAAEVLDYNNPWGFAEVVNINNIDADADANFIAVKIGDVTGDASVGFAGAQNRSTININATDKAVKAGETVAVEFTTEEALMGYQFTLNFAGLQLVDVEYGVAKEENFGFASVDAGSLTTAWNAAESTDLAGQVLFTAVFVATENVQLSSALSINSKVTTAEAVTGAVEAANVALAFNGATANTFAVYQNTPNPFSTETVIGYNAVEAGNATITFTSVEGKVLAVINQAAVKGYNSINVNANDIAATGVVYYTVETANNTATNKMVIVK